MFSLHIRIVLPNGQNRDINWLTESRLHVGKLIKRGDVAEWPELHNYIVESFGYGKICITIQLR